MSNLPHHLVEFCNQHGWRIDPEDPFCLLIPSPTIKKKTYRVVFQYYAYKDDSVGTITLRGYSDTTRKSLGSLSGIINENRLTRHGNYALGWGLDGDEYTLQNSYVFPATTERFEAVVVCILTEFDLDHTILAAAKKAARKVIRTAEKKGYPSTWPYHSATLSKTLASL